MKKISIDINHNPLVEAAIKKSPEEVLKSIQALIALEKTLTAKVELDFKKLTPKKGWDMDNLLDILQKVIKANKKQLEEYFDLLLTALANILAKKQLPDNMSQICLNILKTLILTETPFLSMVSAWGVKHKSLDSGKKLKSIWENHSDKEELMSIGKMHVHLLAPNLSEADIKLTFEQAVQSISTSKLPHFSSILYGDFFITDKLHTQGMYHIGSSDSVWIDSKILEQKGYGYLLHTIIHELSHRYYNKVLNGQEKADWANFYEVTSKNPSVGDIKKGDSAFYDWGLSFTNTIPGVDDIIVEIGEDEDGIASVQFSNDEIYPISKLVRAKAFPTVYASKDPEEFFCETNSLYHQGKIRGNVKQAVESVFEALFIHPHTH